MDASSPTTTTGAPQQGGGTTFFFVAALGITWLLQLPAALATLGVVGGPVETYMPLLALGAFGPLVAAILAARRESGRAGVRALFASLGSWRVGVGWYAVALFGFGAIYVAGSAVFRVCGGSGAGQWLYAPDDGARIIAMVMFPLVEEPGWRGFALPRLQQRLGALRASLVVGACWALWHTMMFITQGMTPLTFAVACVNLLAGSIVFTWLYNRTRGSLLLAVLAHAGAHLSNPTRSVPANDTPFFVYTAAMCVAACALLLFDRRAARDAHAPLDSSGYARSPSAA